MAKSKRNIKNKIAQKKAVRDSKRKANLKKRRAQEPPKQKQASYSDVKKSLAHLPQLAFLPEIRDIGFDQGELQRILDSDGDEPEQLVEVYTPELVEQIKAGLTSIHQNAEAMSDPRTRINVTMVLHFIDNKDYPVYYNPLLLAKFYYEKQRLAGVEHADIDPADISQQVKDFEKEWHDLLQEEHGPSADAAEDGAAAEQSDDLSAPEGAFEQYKQHALQWVQERCSAEVFADFEADIEAFVDDFLLDLNVQYIADLNRSVFNRFKTRFVADMNPTPEDIQKMSASLLLFVDYLEQQALVDAVQAADIRTSDLFAPAI